MTKILMTRIVFYGLMLAGVTLEVFGDALFKKWADGSGAFFIIVGVLVYAAGSLFWALSLKHDTLSRSVGIFMMLNVLAAVVVGVFVFKEELSLANRVGVALALASIAFIELG